MCAARTKQVYAEVPRLHRVSERGSRALVEMDAEDLAARLRGVPEQHQRHARVGWDPEQTADALALGSLQFVVDVDAVQA